MAPDPRRRLRASWLVLGLGLSALALVAVISHSQLMAWERVTADSAADLAWARSLPIVAVEVWAIAMFAVVAVLAVRERRRAAVEQEVEASQRRLAQAQKMEAVGRLAGGIAHDINNHLAAIRAHCELVLHRDQSREQLERKMTLVVDTVLRASSLLERLLTFARRQPTHAEPVDLDEVIEGFEKVLGGALPGTIALELRLAGHLSAVEADVAQLEQLLANLVVNARDAIGSRGTIVITTATRTTETSREVLLSVSDTGCGIPPESREKIFDPFFTTKEGSGSSGLGLATVYAVVEQAGGRIDVDSEVGVGTTFRIALPSLGRPASGTGRVASSPENAPRGSERVLVVDDNEALADAAATFLTSLGYRVRLAASAAEAIGLVADEEFDVVVTDVQLPDRTGPELLATLRTRRPLKVLYMSGYTDRIALRSGQRTDEAFFVKKPFSVAGLSRMLRTLLDAEPGPGD